MDVKSLHFQSVACPRMRTLVLQTMDFQSIVVDWRPLIKWPTHAAQFLEHLRGNFLVPPTAVRGTDVKSTPKRNLPNNLDSSFPHSKPSPALLRQPLLIQDLTRVPGAGFGKIGESGFFGRLSCSVVPHAGSQSGSASSARISHQGGW